MFTGIVEHLGTVVDVVSRPRARTLTIDAGVLATAAVGASVAVDGTCLTVVSTDPPRLVFEVVGETLDRTTLGSIEPGDAVNLERPMAATGRFDGHIVQGHVDGVGVVASVSDDGDERRMVIRVPDELSRFLVEKGSVTVDGVSLTVAGLDGDRIEVALIPHTLAVTTLGRRSEGELVNLEADVLAKYVDRLLAARS